MMREMSSQHMDEWIAFYQIEPWGLAVIDNLLAHFKALTVNMNLPKGKKRYKQEKFLLWPEKENKQEASFEDPLDNM